MDELRSDPAWIDGLSIVAATEDGAVIGHAVVRAALDAAEDMGEVHVVLLGHSTYYPRFGFRRASKAGITLRTEVRDETFMAMSLDPHRPLPVGTFGYAAAFGPEWS